MNFPMQGTPQQKLAGFESSSYQVQMTSGWLGMTNNAIVKGLATSFLFSGSARGIVAAPLPPGGLPGNGNAAPEWSTSVDTRYRLRLSDSTQAFYISLDIATIKFLGEIQIVSGALQFQTGATIAGQVMFGEFEDEGLPDVSNLYRGLILATPTTYIGNINYTVGSITFVGLGVFAVSNNIANATASGFRPVLTFDKPTLIQDGVKFECNGGELLGPGILTIQNTTALFAGAILSGVWNRANNQLINTFSLDVAQGGVAVFTDFSQNGAPLFAPWMRFGAKITINNGGIVQLQSSPPPRAIPARLIPLIPDLNAPAIPAWAFTFDMGSATVIDIKNGGKLQLNGNVNIQTLPNSDQDNSLLVEKGGEIVKVDAGPSIILAKTLNMTVVVGPGPDQNLIFLDTTGKATMKFNNGPLLKAPTLAPNPAPDMGFNHQFDANPSATHFVSTDVVDGDGDYVTTAVTNDGLIAPGVNGNPGLMEFDSALTLTATSSLDIGINGNTAITGYDQVEATGATVLNGTLTVSLTGYTPSLADTFTILNLPSGYTGTFAAINAPAFGPSNNYRFVVNYNSTNVTLSVVSIASLSAPMISTLGTTTGSTAGGTSVTITGANFSNTNSVTFGGVAATSFTVNGAGTQITAFTPSNPAGSAAVTVTTAVGSVSSSTSFTYTTGATPTVTGLNVTSGYTTGGTAVTITGTGFTGATAVTFGSLAAPYFQILSNTQILAYSPTSSVNGAVDVTVSTFAGTSSTSSADLFTYNAIPTPTVSSLSVSSGSSTGNTTVTITGTGFTNAETVYVGTVPVTTFTIASDTSLTFQTPVEPPETIDVTVGSSGGISSLVSGDRYSFTGSPVPTITSLSTSSGTTSGTTQVVLTGYGFSGATAVDFGNVAVTDWVVNADNQITVYSPSEAAATVDVIVVGPSGDSVDTSADHYTYTSATAPTVSGLLTTTGSTAGGTLVDIQGSNFTGATAVDFGSTPSNSFTVLADGSILATAPAEAAGTDDVTIVTPSGTSSTSVSDEYVVTNASTPTVTGLDVTTGASYGGTQVSILGTGFLGATSVSFGAVAAPFQILSDTAITALDPGQAAGTYHITVASPGGTSSTSSADQFTDTTASLPTLTSMSTSTGSSAGGTLVTLTGTGFSTAYQVNIGSTAITDFTTNSDSQVSFLTPPMFAGVWDLSVSTAAGTTALTSSTQFTVTAASAPSISSLGTSTGSTAGGTSVAINGSNFTGVYQVSFGGVPAASWTFNSDSSITAVAPPQAAGTPDVKVVTTAGVSASGSGDQFTYTAASAPSVTSLATTSGSTGGGTLVTINGANFTGATAVTFGTVVVNNFTLNSDSSISLYSPSQAAATVHVTVTTPSGTSSTSGADQFTYNAAAAPAITGLATSTGPTTGGTAFTILGSGFTGATGVTVGGVAVSSFSVSSDGALTTITPPLAAGTLDVRVTTPSGTSSVVTADHFVVTNVTASAPAVTAIDVTIGSTAGGQVVNLTGTNFSGATAVKFGTTSATFTTNGDSSITATAPAGSAGAVDITVITNNGTSATGGPDLFTYLATAAPTVTGVSPSTGTTAGGASVTITGTNFTSATAVLFGGIPAASYSVVSSTSITATAPPLWVGTWDVQVTTPSGTSAVSGSDHFAVTAASVPTVTSLGTSTGGTAGGTSVTITGTNFTGAQAVSIGGVAAAFSVSSSTTIIATTPAQFAGVVDVTVQTYAGTSATSSSTQFTYTVASAPTITSLGTSTGTTAGGTSVTITGTNFTAATLVLFGSVPAASFTVSSSTSIIATSSPQAAGAEDVKVVTYSGDSASSGSDVYTYTAASAPTVSSLSIGTGTTAGGTSVTITGTNLIDAYNVMFGSVPASSFVVNSGTSVTAVAPTQAAATTDITVSTNVGTSATSSADHFVYTNASTPSISSVTASSGSTLGGDLITIAGSGFLGATGVSFGSVAAVFTVINDNAIVATAPAQAAATIDITVTTFAGTSSTGSSDHYTYNAVSAPTVTALSVSTGSSAGGTAVTITGTNLSATTGVFFGGVAATSFYVISSTSIQATGPPQAAGTYDVTVTASGLTSALSSADRFTVTAASAPAVTSVSPSSGSTNGTTSVTITGTNLSGVSSVTFGGVAATFVSNSSTSITATAPVQGSGMVDVIVTTPTGSSAVVAGDEFTYSAASSPTVTGLSLTSGSTAGGTVVTISGTHFTGVTGVSFGTVPAAFTFLTDGILVATAPAQASGTIDVTVITAAGTSATSSADHFTFNAAAAPTVTAVTPATGSTNGGDVITITGTNLSAATAVTFGATAATAYTVLSNTAILATAPAGTVGTTDITVTTPSGTSSTGSADHYVYTAHSAPTVSSLNVSTGPDGGGTVIAITGTNFNAVSQVSFGSYAAASFVVNSSTQVTAVAPAQAAATIDVTVTTPAGTSATSSADHETYTSVAVPTVTSVTPNAGPTGGANTVVVNGTHFNGVTAVYFGATAATSFSINSDGSLFAVAPSGSAGTVHVTVVDSDGTSSTSSNDQYTFTAAPTLSAASPGSDTTTAGTPIVLTGTNLTGAYAVYFGNVPAASFSVTSSTSVTAVSPVQGAGTLNITVLTPGGFSNGQSFTYNASNTITWVGASTGSWGTAANWSGGVLPGSGDDVVIPTGKTVTYSTGTTTVHNLQVVGTLTVTGGALTVTSNSGVANLNLSSGTFTTGANLTVSGNLAWTGGTLANNGGGTGNITITGALTMTTTSALSLSVGVDNQGTATLSGTSGSPGLSLGSNVTFLNDSTGTFTDQTTVNDSISGGTGTFNNKGTFTKAGTGGTAGTTTISTFFSNSGTTALNKGVLFLSGGGGSIGTITTASGTSLSFSSTTFTLSSGSVISGSGSVGFASGTTTVAGALTASGFTITSGATVSGAATFTGNVTNNGALNVAGTGTPGKVTITGNYTQGATGSLKIELGGLTAGTQFDQLAISGAATLAGTLNLSLINSFAPSIGNSFQILTFASKTGTFGTVNGTTQGARTLTPAYNAANVTINVTMAEPMPVEEDLRDEPAEEEGLALLWRRPAGASSLLETAVLAGDFVLLGESEGDALLEVGVGWDNGREDAHGLALILSDVDGREPAADPLSLALGASLLGTALTPMSARLWKEPEAEEKRQLAIRKE
jgi:IPT/TIG domain/G8 domain